MRYEVSKDQSSIEAWRVEAIDQDGISYAAYFIQPYAEQRAREFAEVKNRSMRLQTAQLQAA